MGTWVLVGSSAFALLAYLLGERLADNHPHITLGDWDPSHFDAMRADLETARRQRSEDRT